MIGKKIRMNRIINRYSGKSVTIPLDHGFTLGHIKGLEDMSGKLRIICNSKPDVIILHKGLIQTHIDILKDSKASMIMHLSGSTIISPDPNTKFLTGSLYEAIAMGCDAVSVHVNIGAKEDKQMLKNLAYISSECYKVGFPLLAMMYIRNGKTEYEYSKKMILHAVRIAYELGVDIIKVNYTGDIESFKEIVESCPIPIFIAGGPKINNNNKLFKMVEEAIVAGATGVSIGRNIFQSSDVTNVIFKIKKIVHGESSNIIDMEDEKYFVRGGTL